MSDEIAPALTPAEWAQWKRRRGRVVRPAVEPEPTGPAGADAPAVVLNAFRVARHPSSVDEWDVGMADETHVVDPGGIALEDESTPAIVQGPNLPALIALANAARRDDDPGKITRQDVDDCIAAAQIVESGDGGAPDYEQGARYRALAAKLAALLPPED